MAHSGVETVFVPCDVVLIQVHMGYGENLSPMESVLLRAVHAGLRDVGQLAEVLGLGKRLVHDLVYDLWRQGHLSTDYQSGMISVTSEVDEHIRNGTLDRLRGAESVQESRELMIDKLTGYVQPAVGPHAPPNPRMAVRVENGDIAMEDASNADLLTAIRESLGQEEMRAAEYRSERAVIDRRSRSVRSFRIPPSELRTVAGRRWIRMDVVATVDEITDRLVVTCVDEHLPAERRETASERLTQLAADRPADEAFLSLRRQAESALIDPPSAARAIQRFSERAAAASGIPAGQRLNWHRELCDDARQIGGLLRSRIAGEVCAEPVPGDDHTERVSELIGDARRQIVIAGPWITYNALRRILGPLRAARESGVQIVLLWGIGVDESYAQLDERVRNALADLQREDRTGGGPRLLVPQTSTRTHAKVLVVDDRKALVTSRNLLSAGTGFKEFGVLLSSPGPGGCQTVRDLLGWLRSATPGFEMSRMVAVRAGAFAKIGGGDGKPSDGKPSPSAFERDAAAVDALASPQLAPPTEDAGIAEAEARIWGRSWQAHADAARTFLATRTLPAARLVSDGTHRDVLTRAMRTASRRLVVTSHKINGEVVDEGFAEALRQCLDRGVEVTLVYGQDDSQGVIPARLAELGARYPDRMRVLSGGSNHAKVLVWDDDVLVGSFNYLSFDGRYRSTAVHRERSELSVRLTGKEIADALAAGVGALPPVPSASRAAPVRPSAIPERPSGNGTVQPSPDAYVTAQRILARYADQQPVAELVQAELATQQHPWQVLVALDEDGAPADLVRIATARCLADHAAGAAPDVIAFWRCALMLERWGAGAFVEAAVLRYALDDDAIRPRRPVALLAAARNTPVGSSALEELVWGGDRRPEEQAVGIVAAAGSLLTTGAEAALDALQMFADAPAPWGKLAQAVSSYWEQAYETIPMEQIRADLGGGRLVSEQLAAWSGLDRALGQTGAMAYENLSSNRTHHYLFDTPSGKLAQLGQIVAAQDLLELAAWRRALGNVGQLIVGASRVAAPAHPPIHGAHLKRMVAGIEGIRAEVDAVLRIGAHAEPVATERTNAPGRQGAPAKLGGRALASARVLAGLLSEQWPDLTAAAVRLPQPEGMLAVELLDDLADLAQWGGNR